MSTAPGTAWMNPVDRPGVKFTPTARVYGSEVKIRPITLTGRVLSVTVLETTPHWAARGLRRGRSITLEHAPQSKTWHTPYSLPHFVLDERAGTFERRR